MLYYPNDTIQHAGVVLGLGGIAGHRYASMPRGYPGQMGRAMLTQELTAVTAACMLMRREVFETVRGFDERLAVAFNDIDLCLRIRRAGFRNLWTPFAELYHHESASRGYEDTPEKIKRFQAEIDLMRQRWSELLPTDPAHNVNLPLVSDGSSYAFPPRDASRP
jgi:GT2 family glycosyltransferase